MALSASKFDFRTNKATNTHLYFNNVSEKQGYFNTKYIKDPESKEIILERQTERERWRGREMERD